MICVLSKLLAFKTPTLSLDCHPHPVHRIRFVCVFLWVLRLAHDFSGVGIAFSEMAEVALLQWIPVHYWLCLLTLRGSCKVNCRHSARHNLLVTPAYVPMGYGSYTIKDALYQVYHLLRTARLSDIVILAGNGNVGVGRLFCWSRLLSFRKTETFVGLVLRSPNVSRKCELQTFQTPVRRLGPALFESAVSSNQPRTGLPVVLGHSP